MAAAGNLVPQISVNVSVPPNTVWRVESADNVSGPWQLVEVVSNTLSGVLSDCGHGTKRALAASAVPARYYRLVPN